MLKNFYNKFERDFKEKEITFLSKETFVLEKTVGGRSYYLEYFYRIEVFENNDLEIKEDNGLWILGYFVLKNNEHEKEFTNFEKMTMSFYDYGKLVTKYNSYDLLDNESVMFLLNDCANNFKDNWKIHNKDKVDRLNKANLKYYWI